MYVYVRIDGYGTVAQRDEVTDGELEQAVEGQCTLLKFDRRTARVFFYSADNDWAELDCVNEDGVSLDAEDEDSEPAAPILQPTTVFPNSHDAWCNHLRGGACNCK